MVTRIWSVVPQDKDELSRQRNEAVKNLPPECAHHRSYVGPADHFDTIGASMFNLLCNLGLREHHYLLDIGCGSLRGGRLFLAYLLPKRYYGVEPEEWLVHEAIKSEVGNEFIRLKEPVFSIDRDFNFGLLNMHFDFLVAQSIFSHASQQQIRICLTEARKVMKPGAMFAATYIEGTEDYQGEAWVYPRGVRYTSKCLMTLSQQAGLECYPINWKHPRGQRWLVFTLPGAANAELLSNV